MSQEINPFGDLTDEGLEALLKRAIRITAMIGLLAALVLLFSGWRNAAMEATEQQFRPRASTSGGG